MAQTKIDNPRSPEPRANKVTAQATSSAKSTLPGADEAPAFSSLLAALESFAGTESSLQTGETLDGAGDLPELPHLTALGQQDGLLLAQGHAPWMSLVGQTTRLDTQGDVDLRQGAATDFLSGRGNLTQLAHRQGLQSGDLSGLAGVNDAGAHAAFVGQKNQSNQPLAQSLQAQVATDFDGLDLKADQAEQSQSALLAAAADAVDEPLAPNSLRAELAAQKINAAAHQGISLQGMTAVQPQTLEGLKDLLRGARSSSLEDGGVASKSGSANGSHDVQGAAGIGGTIGGAMGAMMGGAGAGMEGSNQNASDLAQNPDGQDSATAAEQEVSEQVAFWVHQKVQNASLSIQHEGKPIQVQVQLNGQEAHVRFAAQDEQARQLLTDGQSQLRELLEAQGLNLSGVSVEAGGAHQQGADGQSDETQRAQAKSARVVATAAQLPADALNTRPTARSGAPGVDLFV